MIIAALVCIGSVGVQPLGPLTVGAQGAGWECQRPAAVDATPAATPVAVEQDAVAFPPEGGDLTIFAAASLSAHVEQT